MASGSAEEHRASTKHRNSRNIRNITDSSLGTSQGQCPVFHFVPIWLQHRCVFSTNGWQHLVTLCDVTQFLLQAHLILKTFKNLEKFDPLNICQFSSRCAGVQVKTSDSKVCLTAGKCPEMPGSSAPSFSLHGIMWHCWGYQCYQLHVWNGAWQPLRQWPAAPVHRRCPTPPVTASPPLGLHQTSGY